MKFDIYLIISNQYDSVTSGNPHITELTLKPLIGCSSSIQENLVSSKYKLGPLLKPYFSVLFDLVQVRKGDILCFIRYKKVVDYIWCPNILAAIL